MTNRINIFSKYSITEQIGTTLGLVGVILLLSYLFPDKDFGIIKTPKIDNYNFLPIIIGLLLIALNFPVFTKEQNLSIVSYHRSYELQAELGSILSSAKNEIIFWGGNFYNSSNERKAVILDRLKNGIRIKYLIFNPESILCDNVSKDFGENLNHFCGQCVTTIQNLKDLKIEWEKQKVFATTAGGSLEVRLYSQMPRLRCHIIDPHDENAYSYFVHFLYKLDSSDIPAYKVRNGDVIFKTWLNSFNKLWEDQENTLALEKFLEETTFKI